MGGTGCAVSGAVGALVAETAVECMVDTDKITQNVVAKNPGEKPVNEWLDLISKEARYQENIAKIMGATTAAFAGGNVHVGAATGINALQYNNTTILKATALYGLYKYGKILRSTYLAARTALGLSNEALDLEERRESVYNDAKDQSSKTQPSGSTQGEKSSTAATGGGGSGGNQEDPDDGDKYPNNPKKAKDKFKPIGGTKAKQNMEDASVWEKDTSSHGGEQWKRWDTKRSWERRDRPNSIWPDGRIRK